MQIRDATKYEYETIYMMGFDIWSGGTCAADYIQSCHNSPKYKKGQWKVLSDGERVYSSLIVYDLGQNCFGIGSIATHPNDRKQGWGSKIVLEVSKQLEVEKSAEAIFLFADINPEFYKKLEYVSLPDKFQNHESSTCMMRAKNPESVWSADSFQPPRYF